MTTERLTGACHCGAVAVSHPAPPAFINRCNCSLCSKLGVLWSYYDATDVVVNDAPLAQYQRTDVAVPSLAIDRCTTCGCTTCGCTIRWLATAPKDPPRTGINMNLFEPEALAGIEVRHADGRSRVK